MEPGEKMGKGIGEGPNRRRVLVVDDEVLTRFALVRRLGKKFEVFEAGDGAEALVILQAVPIDLVIADLRMPKMDGIALTERIREHWPEVKVIWYSAYSDNESRAWARRLQVEDFLDKPLNAEAVLNLVASYFQRP